MNHSTIVVSLTNFVGHLDLVFITSKSSHYECEHLRRVVSTTSSKRFANHRSLQEEFEQALGR
jgi:hypothetical protein